MAATRTCRGCGFFLHACECSDKGHVEDGGYAYWEGQSVYWDRDKKDADILNIFPSGIPPRDHYSHDHDHIKVKGASISTMRGQTHIVGGYVTFRRINGVEG